MTGALRRLAAWLGRRVGPEVAAAILSVVVIALAVIAIVMLGVVGR